jgi:hypothetical protein
MKAHYLPPQLYCECGRAMMLTSSNNVMCVFNDCLRYGQAFKLPEPEYIELEPTGQGDSNG